MKIIKALGYWVKRVFGHPRTNKPGEYKRLPYRGYNYMRIAEWQRREKKIKYAKPTQTIPSSDTRWAYHVQKDVLRQIKYKRDIKNYGAKEYWATTDEIMKRGCGDCEDAAFVMMRRLIEEGYNPDDIGIILTKTHALVGLWFSDNDFYILDNGSLVNYIVKASEFFKKNNVRLICGFNLNRCWDL